MELSQYGELFLSESREHISAINHLLLALEQNPGAGEPVEGMFRAVHTIKGMSATMGYRAVADLAHEMENLMDAVRMGRVSPGAEMVDLLFAAADALERAVELAVEEGDAEQPEMAPLLARLRVAAGEERRAPVEAPVPREGPEESAEGALVVRLQVAPDSMLPGVRAFLALRRARELGEAFAVHPAEAAMMEEGFDGALTFLLRTELAPDEVRDALLAVGEIAEARVHEDRRGTAAPALPEAESAAGAAAKVRNIRVDLRRLDALMNGVGELVIVRDRLRILARDAAPELVEAVD
ncbi:MAG TPA: Hpt domain-containing protein, partial [Longimicrobium sp.]|nr:Hpt domain-containing protein [Longimicrobium sp.]